MREKQSEISASWFVFAWILLSAWLVACALLIGGELGDGYQTIANARYFFGSSPDYYVQRGPLAGLALWPIEIIARTMQLNPIDVRPYHLYSALLHSGYLLGCWLLIKRTGQPFVVRMIAFAAAILSVVFYANAPYLSHDLIPGFLYLLMIFVCDRFIRDPRPSLALQLLLIGTAVTFIKQTYALFWISICVYALLAYLLKWNNSRLNARKLFALLLLAGLSGVLSWLGYGWFLGGHIPEVSLLERPLKLIFSVSTQYKTDGDIADLFPWDLYVRNIHNYGIAAMLMVIPGIVLAFRSDDARMRLIATCWVIGLITLQLVSFREVRYLAFLAPLTAILILPVVAIALKSRAISIALFAVLAIDQYRAISMAAAQLTSTPVMNVTRFVGEMNDQRNYISSDVLSFVFMANSPLSRDRYHGIFHITAELLFRMNEGRLAIRNLKDPRGLGSVGIRPGDRVFFSNMTLVRRPPWDDANIPIGMDELIVAAGNAAMVTLKRVGTTYQIEDQLGQFVILVPLPKAEKRMPMIAQRELTKEQIGYFYGSATEEKMQVLAIVVDALCQADQCAYFEPYKPPEGSP